LLLASISLALALRAAAGRWGGADWAPLQLGRPQAIFYLETVLIWLLALVYEGAYTTGMSALDRTDRILRALTVGLGITLTLSALLHQTPLVLRFVLISSYLAAALTFTLLRPLLIQHFGLALRSVHLFGSGPRALATAGALNRSGIATQWGPPGPSEAMSGSAVAVCQEGEDPGWQLGALEANFDEIALVPAVSGYTAMGASAVNLHGLQAFLVVHPLRQPLNRLVKRGLDVVLAGLLLVVLSPLLMMLAAAVKLSSPGPAFFAHPRLGRHQRTFRIWKLRTMWHDADAHLAHLLRHDSARRAEFQRDFKLKHDPRITPLGRWLRRLSLDELPQLWNVLRGDMSLVGPRPIVAAEVPRYGALFAIVASVRPGLTGLWQVSGRNTIAYDCRPGFDLEYVRGWSFWRDLAILARTVQALIAPNPF